MGEGFHHFLVPFNSWKDPRLALPYPTTALTLLVYLVVSAVTSAEAVVMGGLTEGARVLMDPELVTRGHE